MKCEGASEPGDVFWENIGTTLEERCLRTSITIIVTSVALVIVFFITLILTFFKTADDTGVGQADDNTTA